MTTAIETKERPILFSGPMVRAILDGRKTQTRRIIKPQPPEGYRSMVRDCDPNGGWWFCNMPPQSGPFSVGEFAKWASVYPTCKYGKPGDRLWVRETFRAIEDPAASDKEVRKWGRDEFGDRMRIVVDYKADNPIRIMDKVGKPEWKPSIHMPRWASRITLEITGVRVERVQSISHRDALAEGVSYDVSKSDGSPLSRFESLWKSLNGAESWLSNPWVWVIEFKKL